MSAPPIVMACHHKTGSIFLTELVAALRGALGHAVHGTNRDRRAPLSSALRRAGWPEIYWNVWFEHAIDVDGEDLRFLHLVREPTRWLRSAYVYHRRGAPKDPLRWLEWRVLRLDGAAASYRELLERLPVTEGLRLEAIRAFPEIACAARIARGVAAFPAMLRVDVDRLASDFEGALSRLVELLEVPDEPALRARLRALDLERREASPHVTRTDPRSAELEAALAADPLVRALYARATAELGYPRAEALDPPPLAARILAREPALTADVARSSSDAAYLAEPDPDWLTGPLQLWGNGHLQMLPFLQAHLDALA